MRAERENSEGAHIGLQKAQVEFRHALGIEEQFWSQQTRVKWLSSGDRNSKFFYVAAGQRRMQGMIHRIKIVEGTWVKDDGDIASETIQFFSDLYSESVSPSSKLLQLISPILMQEDNLALEDIPSMEEAKHVIHAMDRDSTAGPDGFTGKFFTFAWDIIAQDMYNAIVLSRILSDRVAALLPKIIFLQQSGFVRGRNITENYLLAQEVIAGIGKKLRGENVVLKLDMAKAYDGVSWLHLTRVLRKFGFGKHIIDMV
nr:uncharacterized protein LOC113739336 [Coffea arabica]